MSKRNLTLLIIVLVMAILAVFGFLYFRQGTTTPTDDGTGTNFFSQFNPFGTSTQKPPTTTPPTDVSGYIPPPPTEIVNVKLKKVSSMPVAGFTLYSKERLKDVPIPVVPETSDPSQTLPLAGDGKITKKVTPTQPKTEFATATRYVERATGNIYQTFADKIVERKFSGTVIPKIYEAYFGSRAESVVMRYLKSDDRTIETFVGTLPKEYLGADTTAVNEVKGSFLPENIKDVSISPDGSKVFYLFNVGDNIVGATYNLGSKSRVQIFDSPFTEWSPLWPNSKVITLTTKPSSGVPGYMYALDPDTKKLNKVIGNIGGLTTLGSPNGKLVLYSDSNLSLYVYHLDTNTVDTLGVRTLAEKCIWGKVNDSIYCAVPKFISGATYPDGWYQGEVSFSDQLWKIDIKTGNTTIISDPVAVVGGEDVDGIKLALDEAENYLFFVNKKDSFLWEFELK